MATFSNGIERRRFGRRAVFKVMTVVQGDGERIDGHVVDWSEGGARLRLSDPKVLMPEFYVEIPEDDLIVRCRLVHIYENTAGVEFCRAPRRLSWVRRSRA